MDTTLPRPIRVMIVDDSAVIRLIIEKILKTDDNVSVCGFADSGQKAVDTVNICNPDIILLDIEMPVMDGITAIPHILAKAPHVKIIMCSTLSDRGADISIKALSLGATDCILKPSGAASIQGSGGFHTELLRMINLIGRAAVRRSAPTFQPKTNLATRQAGTSTKPDILAIGSSTGGPNALSVVLKQLGNLSVPIVITQHMPKTFTKMLADHLSKTTPVTCFEGEEGMLLKAGCAYIAPGGYHMVFKKTPEGTVISLDDGPIQNFCKPSVDPMLKSLVKIYDGRILTVILTGMGEDGLGGAQECVDKGGRLIAQDEQTSVVWGMPGAVAKKGLCHAILPLQDIAEKILTIIGKPPLFGSNQPAGGSR